MTMHSLPGKYLLPRKERENILDFSADPVSVSIHGYIIIVTGLRHIYLLVTLTSFSRP